jgi:hypothetical protein
MAIQVWDGFDHYDNGTDFLSRSGNLQYNGNAEVIAFTTGREGAGKALTFDFTHTGPIEYVDAVFYQRVASAFVGFAQNAEAGQQPLFFEFWDTLTNKVQVSVLFRMDNYSIQIFRGNAVYLGSEYGGDGSGLGTQLATTGNNAWTPGVWNFIEIWPVINSSTGSVELRINNVVILNVTGVDTQATANASWDSFQPGGQGVSGVGVTIIDDLYYGDTTVGVGSYPGNAPIGDCHVQTLFAVGNSSVQFTPLANANWQEISETAMDSDTSYNYDSTVGNEDRFNFAALPSTTSLIYGIQLTGAYRKDDSGGRQVKQGVKSGTTETYGANHALGDTSYTYFTDQWILDPNTSANWTTSGLNAISAGYNVAA